jgi:linoleoyl-CoA desaturase
MTNKHIHIKEDISLLHKINRQIRTELVIDPVKTKRFLILKFLVYFTLTVLNYWALFQITNPFWFMVAYISYGYIALLFAFNFAHDCSHNTVFESDRWNSLGFIALYTMMGAHAEAWRARHVHSHHFAPNVDGYDSDLSISPLIRVIPGSPFRWYNRYQHWYAPLAYTTYSLFWIFIKDFVLLFQKEEYGLKKDWKYYVSFVVQKLVYLGYLLVLPLLFAKQTVAVILIGFLMMHLMQSLFLLFTFFMTHHVEETFYPTTNESGEIQTSWLNNQIWSSNDFYPFSEPANFIFGGFNNHIAHHLFPQIHHVHYPKLNRILYRMLKEEGIVPNQTTYFGGALSHLRLLKRMSTPNS